jgi:hypothetical protein
MRSQTEYYEIQEQIMAREERSLRRERYDAPDLEDPVEKYWSECEEVNEDGTRKK